MNLTKEQKEVLLEKLLSFISDHKNQLFEEIIKNRTRYLTIVLEDIYQPQNASAVLRTADCFGIQDVHIIENRNEYIINPEVALGASKWLTLQRYSEQENNTLEAIQKLKAEGYRIVATMPHREDVILPDMDMNQKTALFFGNELNGLSEIVQQNADLFVKIPMYGFTESYNLSVSAALCLQELTNKMRNEGINWQGPQMHVVMEFVEDSWAEVHDGNQKRVLYGLFRAGTRRELTIPGPASVYLGRVQGVVISVDDTSFNVPQSKRAGNTARFTIEPPQ